MPIILVNGANGHGKGQLAIKMILDYQKANDSLEKEGKPRRQIYANIHGINEGDATPLPDVKPIPSDKVFFGKQDNPEYPPPEGYFVPPVGSIFFYDECQKLEWAKRSRNVISDDVRVTSLEEHRHAGLDVVFLTQSTNYIHSHIAGLVAPHYYVERPLGLPSTNVFMFNKFQKSPDSVTTRSKADDQFMLKLGKGYGKYYKSSAEHNIKSTFPLKAKLGIAVLLLCIIYTGYKYFKSDFFNPEDDPSDSLVASQPVPDVNTNHPPSASSGGSEDALLTPNHLLSKYLPPVVVETAYYEDIRAAMIIESSVQCKALNKYGERLNISNEDCLRMSGDPSFIPRSRIESDYKQAAYSDSSSSLPSSDGSQTGTSVNLYPSA